MKFYVPILDNDFGYGSTSTAASLQATIWLWIQASKILQ